MDVYALLGMCVCVYMYMCITSCVLHVLHHTSFKDGKWPEMIFFKACPPGFEIIVQSSLREKMLVSFKINLEKIIENIRTW